jgi:hypothetical protein
MTAAHNRNVGVAATALLASSATLVCCVLPAVLVSGGALRIRSAQNLLTTGNWRRKPRDVMQIHWPVILRPQTRTGHCVTDGRDTRLQ